VPPIRVVIADDVPLVRSGLRNALAEHSDIVIVAEAGNGDEAVRFALRHQPDVVLMDVSMPVLDGLGATRLICSETGVPPIRVLILSIHEDDDVVFDALRSGASGFVLKDSPPDEVVAAVRTVAAGESVLSPRLTSKLVRDLTARPPHSRRSATLGQLTQRERDVLQLIAAGLHNDEIARILVVSETTVKTHVQRLYRKLSLRDRVHAVIFAYQNGLAHPPEHSPSVE
jgi:DNA-binding NarL/FixJ family response regulator